MRRLTLLVLAASLLLRAFSFGEGVTCSLSAPDEAVRPGMASVISFFLPEDGTYSMRVLNEGGEAVSAVFENRELSAGANSVYWNGTWQGEAAPEGAWRLVLEGEGQTAEDEVTVGSMGPVLISLYADRDVIEQNRALTVSWYASVKGTVTLYEGDAEDGTVLMSREAEQGWTDAELQVELEPGKYELYMVLTGEDGISSEPGMFSLEVTEETLFTPSYTSPYPRGEQESGYWTLPMDITDEQAVWEALMAPVTVLDNGKKNAEKTQVVIRSKPDSTSDGVGVVTCITQGVRVIEKGEEWTLIECYSSSFHDSPILNWNRLVQGYVPTEYLKETVPSQKYGIVIDKLTQRLYLFMDGHLYTTLQVSTGLANSMQPYNETRSGEYLLTSAVGAFNSGNLVCGLALRFNRGDLLHEVPYILQDDGGRNYKACEPDLGTKASHGCIRVQRKESPEGVNMQWLWDNRQTNTKLLIWEDWQGRQIPVPDDDTPLYWDSSGSRKLYHSSDRCALLREGDILPDSFTYGELDSGEYASLARCDYCAPPLREAEIAAVNEKYEFGRDHNPVLTEALKTCPKKLRRK